ncbi:MAG: hypothetical protein ATN31_06330 [Candidatus Epulonipiscioides saccharophilum]|nr:MAG: hypothetical protein ATN31_06330 [Epulopiscium sp. AS2M-Bin001]
MNETAQVLNSIYHQYGNDIFKNKNKLKQLVQNLLDNKYTSMLILAIDQDVAKNVANKVKFIEDNKEIDRIVDELFTRYFWRKDAAFEVVNYFVKAKFSSIRTNVNLISKENLLFKIADNSLVKFVGKNPNVIVPEHINRIADKAFSDHDEITNVIMPKYLDSIGVAAFFNCSNLESVDIPNGVSTIEDSAFEECTNLKHIIIPTSVKSIRNYSFAYCNNLVSIEIPNGVTSIGTAAFLHCGNLISIIIPSSVNHIDDWAFYGCNKLKEMNLSSSMEYIGNQAMPSYLIKNIN